MILSERDLVLWGERIGREVEPPVFLALRGELGAGKSVLARAVARGSGFAGAVPSPTFNFLFRYPVRDGIEIVHMDLYRLRSPEELWELGWGELGKDHEIVLVEWPERAGDHLPPDRWEVVLTPSEPGSHLRTVEVSKVGSPSALPGFPVSLRAED
jgi:tRNA threonylcarbamoyl adenosine modification protein YjeE